MLEALIAGQHDPKILASMAHGNMRSKLDALTEALSGHFEDHHAFLARTMLTRIDALSTQIEDVSTRIEAVITPFSHQVQQLDEITGVGPLTAQELIAEIGVDATRFPTAAHLVSWAKFAPIDNKSAGKGKATTTGTGEPPRVR
jgi:transposase